MVTTAADYETRLKQLPKTKDITGSTSILSAPIAQLKMQFEQLLPKLAEIAPENSSIQTDSTNNPAFDRVALSQQLNELKQFLADDDMQATRLGNEIGKAYGAALGIHWMPIAQAMNQLDFSAALSACILLQDSLAEND
jgi:hypothetical protein